MAWSVHASYLMIYATMTGSGLRNTMLQSLGSVPAWLLALAIAATLLGWA
jgi:hypothetical protein